MFEEPSATFLIFHALTLPPSFIHSFIRLPTLCPRLSPFRRPSLGVPSTHLSF